MNSYFSISSYWLHSNCSERERAGKLMRQGVVGQVLTPPPPKFIDLFAFALLCMWPEINGKKNSIRREHSTVQSNPVQDSTLQYITDVNVFTGIKTAPLIL